MENKKEKMEMLINTLNKAAEAYYNKGESNMTDAQYDELRDQLEKLEKSSGTVLPNSPTQKVGASVEQLVGKKRKHEFPMLSLDKTKDIELLNEKFSEGEEAAGIGCMIMYKLDGTSLSVEYADGELLAASLRGDSLIGPDVTHLVKAGKVIGIPQRIDYDGKLIVRGETVMSFREFDRINENLSENEERFKNPRNLCSSQMMAQKADSILGEINFLAFSLVYVEDMPITLEERFSFLEELGFNVVPYECTSTGAGMLKDKMRIWEASVKTYDYPIDGLVIALNNANYTDRLPGTSHHPHILGGYAFKFEDEVKETVLREIIFSPTRTGLLVPVARFDEVELEGTTVSRATLHNISYILKKDLKIGDRIEVAKMNQIIPAVVSNLDQSMEWTGKILSTERMKRHSLIDKCPCCGTEVTYKRTTDTIVAKCANELCSAKKIGFFEKFVSKKGMNIFGISEMVIKDLLAIGLEDPADFWNLDRFKQQIIGTEKYGEQSSKILRLLQKWQENVILYIFLQPYVSQMWEMVNLN